MTEGDKRVRSNSNPDGDDDVGDFKNHAASLIDLIEMLGNDDRLTEICKTAIEEAAMWGVKSITTSDIDSDD